MNWQESNVIHFAISPCVTLHPETVANVNLSPILRLYSYSYYTCVPYFGCFNHMRMCLFVHGASIILSHSAHEKYWHQQQQRPQNLFANAQMLPLCHHSHYILSLILNSIELDSVFTRKKALIRSFVRSIVFIIHSLFSGMNSVHLRIFFRTNKCVRLCVRVFLEVQKSSHFRFFIFSLSNFEEKNVWRQRQVISNLKIKLNLTQSQKRKHHSNGKKDWIQYMLVFSRRFSKCTYHIVKVKVLTVCVCVCVSVRIDLIRDKNNDARYVLQHTHHNQEK